jgi:hypothetical protein
MGDITCKDITYNIYKCNIIYMCMCVCVCFHCYKSFVSLISPKVKLL